jgi:hypothetical protein
MKIVSRHYLSEQAIVYFFDFASLASEMNWPDFDRTGPDRFLSRPDWTGHKKSVRFQLWYGRNASLQ